jgi:hypothetical protein
MDQLQLAWYRQAIRRKMIRLKLRFRLLLFLESVLLGLTVVLSVSAAVVFVGKLVYLPGVLRSPDTLRTAVEFVTVAGVIWASARPVPDLELASFIDREINQPSRIESAVDFLGRPDEIDPLHLGPFLKSTVGILNSTPDRQIIGLQLPRLWRYAALALALLVAVQLFVPVARLVGEDQDPFLIRDMHRLSRELEGTLLTAARHESVSEEDKELFEKARELSRRMDAKTIDPSYLQDELLRLTRGVGERSDRLRSENDRLLTQLLEEIERLRQDQESKGVQNAALKRALDELSRKTRDMQELSVQQRLRTAQELTDAVQQLLSVSENQLNQEDRELIQHIISEMQSQLQQDQDLKRISEVAERSLQSLRKDSIQDLMFRGRDQLSEQAMEFLRSQRGLQQGGSYYPPEGQGEAGFQIGAVEDIGFGRESQGEARDAAEGGASYFGLVADDESGQVDSPSEGIGTGVGGDLFGGPSGPIEGYRTYIDHRLPGEGGELDLTFSTVLGSPASGEVRAVAPGQIEPSFGDAYEGQIPEGEYPERYKQIISDYFDGLR